MTLTNISCKDTKPNINTKPATLSHIVQILLVFYLACLNGIASEAQEADLHESASCAINDTCFRYLEFYRATKEKETVYIHGTFHVAKLEEMPDILRKQMGQATSLFLERFSRTEESQTTDVSLKQQEYVTKFRKRENEPDWNSLFREHKVESDIANPVTIYDFLTQHIAPNLARITNQVTIEQLLTNFSALAIYWLILPCMMEETSDPSTAYDYKIANSFREVGKGVTYMETLREVMDNTDGMNHESPDEILHKSI
jgi:uncharacterized protein YbaP (TraB family)